jgi:hypothetical protein
VRPKEYLRYFDDRATQGSGLRTGNRTGAAAAALGASVYLLVSSPQGISDQGESHSRLGVAPGLGGILIQGSF